MADNSSTLETSVPGRPAIPDILEEHLEEIGYLCIQRRKLLFSPEIPLRRVRIHGGRIEAHFDALRIGGPAAIAIAQAMLDGDDPWFVCAAARVWLDLGRPDVQTVLATLDKVPPPLRRAWKEALRSLPAAVVQQLFAQPIAGTLSRASLEFATDVLGWHGLLTPTETGKIADSTTPGLRRAVARHAAEPGLLAKLLEDPDAVVRRMALWSLALQNASAALSRAREAVSAAPDPFGLRVLGLLGGRSDARVLFPFLEKKEFAPAALLALRDLACPEVAEGILVLCEGEDAELAAAATAVFESLCGQIPRMEPILLGGVSPARFHWMQIRKGFDISQRRLGGHPFPWKGLETEEPMELLWRRVLASPSPELAWLRREVPDGFFTAIIANEAIPGE